MTQERILPPTTIVGEEDVDKVAKIISLAFKNDPFTRAILQEKHEEWNEKIHNTFDTRLEIFSKVVKADQQAGATMTEAGNWGFVGIWQVRKIQLYSGE